MPSSTSSVFTLERDAKCIHFHDPPLIQDKNDVLFFQHNITQVERVAMKCEQLASKRTPFPCQFTTLEAHFGDPVRGILVSAGVRLEWKARALALLAKFFAAANSLFVGLFLAARLFAKIRIPIPSRYLQQYVDEAIRQR